MNNYYYFSVDAISEDKEILELFGQNIKHIPGAVCSVGMEKLEQFSRYLKDETPYELFNQLEERGFMSDVDKITLSHTGKLVQLCEFNGYDALEGEEYISKSSCGNFVKIMMTVTYSSRLLSAEESEAVSELCSKFLKKAWETVNNIPESVLDTLAMKV